MNNYSEVISWTNRNGATTEVKTKGCSSKEEAIFYTLRSAVRFGWTEPKWWQWWRKTDRTLLEILENR